MSLSATPADSTAKKVTPHKLRCMCLEPGCKCDESCEGPRKKDRAHDWIAMTAVPSSNGPRLALASCGAGTRDFNPTPPRLHWTAVPQATGASDTLYVCTRRLQQTLIIFFSPRPSSLPTPTQISMQTLSHSPSIRDRCEILVVELLPSSRRTVLETAIQREFKILVHGLRC